MSVPSRVLCSCWQCLLEACLALRPCPHHFVLQAERISDDFFAALERVRTIHANCRSLLRSHHQRAGLELMEIMSNHQEAAYERLCRWPKSGLHV